MGVLEKAYLQALKPSATPEVDGPQIPVQFNPTSMRLSMTNSIDGGRSRGRQVQQYNGTSSTSLSLDLVFDTADEMSTGPGGARNVRERTTDVAKFVLPSGEQTKQAPPRVRFHWGTFVFDGVMTSLTEDIDLFSAEGVPLRAKVTIAIKEQDPKYEALESGAGANSGSSATNPGGSGGAGTPGTAGGGPTDRTAQALDGESAADFAARMGLDPAAWRGVAAGADSALALQAGAEIDFSSNLSLSAGVGVSAGVEFGASASLEGSLGLSAGGTASADTGIAAEGRISAAGFALAAAGGVSAAAQALDIVKTGAAAARARSAFQAPVGGAGAESAVPGAAASAAGVPAALGGGPVGLGSLPPAAAAAVTGGARVSAATPLRPEQPRPRLFDRGIPSPSQQAAAPAGPRPPTADPRSSSFGFGVPLRPRVGVPMGGAPTRGWVTVGIHPTGDEVPTTRDPAASPWETLPAEHAPRAGADREQRRRFPSSPCGCAGAGGPCGHPGRHR